MTLLLLLVALPRPLLVLLPEVFGNTSMKGVGEKEKFYVREEYQERKKYKKEIIF